VNEGNEIYGLVGALFGVVAAIVPHIIPWLTDRGKLARERKRMEFAKLEVDFISAWMEAASSYTDDEIEKRKNHAKAHLVNLLDSPELLTNKHYAQTEKSKTKYNIKYFVLWVSWVFSGNAVW